MKIILSRLVTALILLGMLIPVRTALGTPADSTGTPSESDYYRLVSLPIPSDIVLEVGGLDRLPNGKLAVATRRGEIWLVGNPSMKGGAAPYYQQYARGLFEPLGLVFRDGAFYTTQRGELTRLVDTDGDAQADRYEQVYQWPLSGHYHEYSYGPAVLPDGRMAVTGNVAFGDPEWWDPQSYVPWRGWTMIIDPETGTMKPFATGMRSPNGIFVNEKGDIFYSENQGDWIGSGFITHLEEGDFTGNPAGLHWADHPQSPVNVRRGDITSSDEPMFETARNVPGMKLPAVWLPHTMLGTSTSGIVQDTAGTFGPFEGHYFVGDQGHSLINRVYMEQVDGAYQGAAFPFRKGFASGVLRMTWGEPGAMYVGMTDRGWASVGEATFGLQRLIWTGKTPFEMQTIQARPDGFELTFTRPVDRELAADPGNYSITSFTYKYHSAYGSPPIEQQSEQIKGLKISADGKSVRLVTDDLREKYIHEIKLGSLRSKKGIPLLHDVAYYTLNNIPSGEGLSPEAWTAKREADGQSDTAGITNSADSLERKSSPPKGNRTRAEKRQTQMPGSWSNGPDQAIRLGTEPELKFDKDQITVEAGSRIAITFVNNDDMLHNAVIVAPQSATKVGELAMELGLNGEEMDYVPDSPKVLHFTKLLKPGQSETIYFTAPAEPGSYQFVCTFPGHFYTMRGELIVQ